ncbi:MAG: AAA family ATPase [Thermodesulfobacteriota bacterium]|nr:AAA family ATPase [Thermodesulfobacteriota bacterium]
MQESLHTQLELFHLAPRNEGKPKVDWTKGGLRSITIQRFKRFREFKIDFDRLTLLVGTNSSGKTSVLQAIRLFFWCVEACLRKDGNECRFAKAVIPFSDSYLIPAHDLRELSFKGVSPNRRTLGIILTGTLENGLTLTFRIYASYYTLMVVDPEGLPDDPLTAEQVSVIDRAPLYIPGFFGVVSRELLAHDAHLDELLNSGHHNEVLRNIILRLKGDKANLDRLQQIMKKEFKITGMDLPFSEKTTQYLKAEYSESDVRVPLDFVSAGSGFLQVLQIMAHALQNPSPILLLDEPDAHMHHSLQRSFLKLLRSFANSEDLQIVMASHSETFLRETPLEEIRVIDAAWREAGKFPDAPELQEQLSQAGIWPTQLELAEILRTRRVLIVEGDKDEKIVHRVGRLAHADWDTGARLIQMVHSDGSDDATVRRLEYVKEILNRILPDGLQIAHLRDRDLLCDSAVIALKKEAKGKKLPLHILDIRNREILLVRPDLVERAVRSQYSSAALPNELADQGAIASLAEEEIKAWCHEEVDELPVKVQEYNRTWVRRTFDHEDFKMGERKIVSFIRTAWQEPISQGQIPWKLIDGKTILRRIRKRLQAVGLSLPEDAIFDVMTLDDYGECLKDTVHLLSSWFG